MGMKRRRRISSGDKLVDWFFMELIRTLNRPGTHIYLIKSIKDRSRGKQRGLLGLCVPSGSIYYSELFVADSWAGIRRSKDKKGSTLLHECAHALLPGVRNRSIERLEKLLWSRLNPRQKNIVKSYLPRHLAKKSP